VNEWSAYKYPFETGGWDIAHYIHFGHLERGLPNLPNTKATWELHHQGLTPNPELYQYHCNTTALHDDKALNWLIENNQAERGMVAVHYQGNSSPDKKDLQNYEAYSLCDWLKGEGFQPWLIDYGTSTLVDYPCPTELLNEPEESVANLVALIAQSRFMVAINSGPACFAACTNTPTFVLNRGFHPATTFDPAPNLIHLLTESTDDLLPEAGREDCLDYFDENYNAIYTDNILDEVRGCITECFAEPYDEELGLRLLKEFGGICM